MTATLPADSAPRDNSHRTGRLMRTTWTFHSAGQLLFGRDAVLQLGDVAGELGLHKLLVVTDPVLVKAGLVDRVLAPLKRAGVAVTSSRAASPSRPSAP